MGEQVSYEELVARGELDERVTSINQDGTPRKVYEPIEEEEQLDILSLMEESLAKGFTIEATYKYIAKVQGRSPEAIKYFLKKLRSTKTLAKMKLEAGLSKMVDRVIEKAPTTELIDILSRPNIGILEPAKRGGEQTGFVLSVQADTCGSVKVGVAAGVSLTPGAAHGEVMDRPIPAALAQGTRDTDTNGRSSTQESDGGRERETEGGDAHETNVQPVEAQGELPRRQDRGHRQHQKVQRVQGAHGQPAAKRAVKRGSRKINLNYPHESFDQA